MPSGLLTFNKLPYKIAIQVSKILDTSLGQSSHFISSVPLVSQLNKEKMHDIREKTRFLVWHEEWWEQHKTTTKELSETWFRVWYQQCQKALMTVVIRNCTHHSALTPLVDLCKNPQNKLLTRRANNDIFKERSQEKKTHLTGTAFLSDKCLVYASV